VTLVSQYGCGQTETGKVFVPPSTEAFTHDADGDLTADGRWTYSWDGENRLVQMIHDSDSPTGARQQLVFEYDHHGRRIRKQFYTYNNGWQEQTDTVFLYGGWNLIAELNANAGNARVRTYVWGTDLSGSMQGAGGVGGLVKLTYYGAFTTNAFVAYDGNGNVTALIDAANGNVCARYEYGPFAEPIRSSGPLSKLNPIRFSSKYTDNESGLLYYGYRYYNPSTGRWMSRDPIGERGGRNLYAFARCDSINQTDGSGLFDIKYIDVPKWVPKFEWFWMGVSFGFDAADSAALRGTGAILFHYSADVQVTHCAGPTVSDARDFYKINRFQLNDQGHITHSDYRYSFTDNTIRIPFQMALWNSFDLFRQSPDYKQLSRQDRLLMRGTSWQTKGKFTASLEYRVLPLTGKERLGEFFLPPTPYDVILTPEYGAHDYLTANPIPEMWGNGTLFAGTIQVQFNWDNCCQRTWHYSVAPKLTRGPNRSDRVGVSYPESEALEERR